MSAKNPSPRRSRSLKPHGCLGPIADLEAHLPEEWWREIFDALYVMTDGDVVENDANTRIEVDAVVQLADITPSSRILDLCCGQGRHCLELARRGYGNVIGIDRSRYLIRLARKRAAESGLFVTFREGDARRPRLSEASIDCALIMGNSFGYFSTEHDDLKVLEAISRCARSSGTLFLDVTEGDWIKEHFEPRSWEWIDQNHFVCRERSLSADSERLISREVIVHAERGVLADQFYAERLYSREKLAALLEEAGFRNIRLHGNMTAQSERGMDLGMMARRMIVTAKAPLRIAKAQSSGQKSLNVTVIMGDPRLSDPVKRGGQFNPEDIATVNRLKEALADLSGYSFNYLDDHSTLVRVLDESQTDLIFNLCDEGWNNDAFKELHVPALLEVKEIPYTGAGPACLAACYDKALVRAVASALEVPVPLETFVRPDDQGATLPSVFPALLKPNFGDSSVGITAAAVVRDKRELLEALERLKAEFPNRPVLVQEFLNGSEISVGLIGNPAHGMRALPILEVDYSQLDSSLPQILSYESKWVPDSPFWTQIRYREAHLDESQIAQLVDASTRLFERLGCRDYARFDFRADSEGTYKLLEVNPNPGWCWDGKLNIMAGYAGLPYSGLLESILQAAVERVGLIGIQQGRQTPKRARPV
jgi:D-alanine-D-alanine ligase